MPSDRDGTTHGVWFGKQDEHLPRDFKETFRYRRDPFALSGEIRHAMRMHIAVQDALDDVGLGDNAAFTGEDRNESRTAEAEKREFVKQAIRNEAYRQQRWSPGEEADANPTETAETESQISLETPSQ